MRGLTIFLLLAICALSSGAILKRGVKENSFIEVNVGGEQVETIFDEEDISDDDDGLSDDDDQDEFDEEEEEDNEEIDEDEEEEFDDEEDEEIDDDDDEEFEDTDSEIENRKQMMKPTKCGNKIIEPGKSTKIHYVFTKGYPTNTYCKWNITTSSDAILEMKCRVKQIRKTPDCKRDFVQIGSKKFCGNLKRTLKAGSSVTIKFESKSRKKRHRNKGFACKVTAMKPVDKPGEVTVSDNCACGVPYRGGSRIVDGMETLVNFYPYQVGFRNKHSSIWCGGAILTDQYIVSAAHCFTGETISDLVVNIGEHDQTTDDETSATVMAEIESITMHQKYNSNANDDDIALVKLKNKITFSERVGPVCLPEGDKSYVGEEAYVAGWGHDQSGGSNSDTLMETLVNVVSNTDCSSIYPNLTPFMLCAGGDGKDSCQNDSGGPLSLEIPDPNDASIYYYEQIGVVAFGKGCGDNGVPGVYMRLSKYMPWLMPKISGKMCKRPF